MRKQYHRYHLCTTSPWAVHLRHCLLLHYTLSGACIYASLCSIVAGSLILGFLNRYHCDVHFVA